MTPSGEIVNRPSSVASVKQHRIKQNIFLLSANSKLYYFFKVMRFTFNAIDNFIIDSYVLVDGSHFKHRLVLEKTDFVKPEASESLLICT